MQKYLAIVSALTVLLMAAPSLADIGRVKRVTGSVTVERAGTPMAAKPGLVLDKQDVLVTGDKSRVSVTFIDNSRFSAGPNSRIVLETFEFNATTHEGKFVSRVERGTLGIVSGQIAKQTPDAMRVRTPTSILGVRGTKFVVEVGQ
ncbi:MAG: hypothetical protein HOK54_22830 [Alphaproteobacteria bacterium]|jgi:hypothetical protein|nr:hypothetical protein [Alphaproteobacteria bacterium]